MTKKEQEMIDKIITILDTNMKLQTELLAVVKGLGQPGVLKVVDRPDVLKPVIEQTNLSTEEPKNEKTQEPTETKGQPSVATDGNQEKLNIPKPKEYKIEDCREVLGKMVEVMGEKEAWEYLGTFKVEMLPDLDPSQYEKLVTGAESLLAAHK